MASADRSANDVPERGFSTPEGEVVTLSNGAVVEHIGPGWVFVDETGEPLSVEGASNEFDRVTAIGDGRYLANSGGPSGRWWRLTQGSSPETLYVDETARGRVGLGMQPGRVQTNAFMAYRLGNHPRPPGVVGRWALLASFAVFAVAVTSLASGQWFALGLGLLALTLVLFGVSIPLRYRSPSTPSWDAGALWNLRE
jgi:hypothetical protein